MNRPRIKRDAWTPSGWVCRSTEAGGFTGTHPVIGSGDTVAQAYYNWRQKCLSDPRRPQET